MEGLPKLEGELTVSKEILYQVLNVLLRGEYVCEFEADKVIGKTKIDRELLQELYRLYMVGEKNK